MEQQQKLQQVHISSMIESLTNQVKNLSSQLADAHGIIAVLQQQLKDTQEGEAPEGELASKLVP